MKNPQEILKEYPGSIVFARVAEELAARGELDSARDILDKGIVLHPGYAPGYAVSAGILSTTMDRDGALEALERAVALDSQSPADLLRLAKLYIEMDRRDDAESILGCAMRYDPDAPPIADMLLEAREKAAAAAADTATVPQVEVTAHGMETSVPETMTDMLPEPVETAESAAPVTDEDIEPIEIVKMEMTDDEPIPGQVEIDDAVDISAEVTDEVIDEAAAETEMDIELPSDESAEPAEPVEMELSGIEDLAPGQVEIDDPAVAEEEFDAAEITDGIGEAVKDTLPAVEEPEGPAVGPDDASITIAPRSVDPAIEAQDTDMHGAGPDTGPLEETVMEPAVEPADSAAVPSDAVDGKPLGDIDLSWLDEEVPDEKPAPVAAEEEESLVAIESDVIDLDGLDDGVSDYSALFKDADAGEEEPAPEEAEADAPSADEDTIPSADEDGVPETADVMESEELGAEGLYPDLSAEEIDVLSDTEPPEDAGGEMIMDEDEEGIDYSDILAKLGEKSTAGMGDDNSEVQLEGPAAEIDTSPQTLPDDADDDGPVPPPEPTPWEVNAESAAAAEADSDSMRAIEELIRSAPDLPFAPGDDISEIPSAAPEPETQADSDIAAPEPDVPEAAPVIEKPETAPASGADEPTLGDLISRYEKTFENTDSSEETGPSTHTGLKSDCTVTMAEIYVAQGLVSKAVDIYTVLTEREPDNTLVRTRLETLRTMRDERTDES